MELKDSRLLEAFILGLAAGAYYVARRRRPCSQQRSSFPDFAGDFAL